MRPRASRKAFRQGYRAYREHFWGELRISDSDFQSRKYELFLTFPNIRPVARINGICIPGVNRESLTTLQTESRMGNLNS